MIKIYLGDLPLHIWNDIFKWIFETQKTENYGITWDYNMENHTLYLSEKTATMFFLKWS